MALSMTDAPTDALITAAIARLSTRLDNWTNDHFETDALTLDLDVYLASSRLRLPKRCTAVTTVNTRSPAGVLTLQPATAYRLSSSLEQAGSLRTEGSSIDTIDIILDTTLGLTGTLWDGEWVWPVGTQTVQVVGSFGWTDTPADIKRAMALLVWDHFKPQASALRQASRQTSADLTVEYAITEPSGIPEVDDIIADYKRDSIVAVG
jgi:hypothetical protein